MDTICRNATVIAHDSIVIARRKLCARSASPASQNSDEEPIEAEPMTAQPAAQQ
jgi:hypothetical protein